MPIQQKDLNSLSKREINRAGARYTPQIEDGAPNMQIKNVLDALDALSFSNAAKQKLENLSTELRSVWEKPPKVAQLLFQNRKQTPTYIAEVLDSLKKNIPGEVTNELQKLTRSVNFVYDQLYSKRNELLNSSHRESDSDEKANLQYDRRQLDEVLDIVNKVRVYINTPTPNFFKNNLFLLLGDWGTGKTHTLADITEQRISDNKPSLFILAHHLSSNDDPLSQICFGFDLDCNKQELLDFLQSEGESNHQRSLLIIDGINEGDQEYWSKIIGQLADEISNYPNIGLVLSCRTPYDQYLFTNRERAQFEIVTHRGFTESEVNAQEEFFNYYEIPIPQVPLLNPEFSRPLFLKLFCKAIENRTASTKRKKIHELANGQKGMTYLFEYFSKNVGEPIENEFGLTRKTCWKILKGDRDGEGDNELKGIAVTMAKKGRRYVTKEEAIDIVNAITPIDDQDDIKEFIQRMVNEGLLLEDLRYENGQYSEIIRLPYQRFSDHVIARYLLYSGGYLNKESKETIRRSFYKNRPLGKIFVTDQFGNSFSDPGLASALMLEFPEAVKKSLPENERELIAYIPKKRRFFKPIAESFLDGLIWRNTETFSKQTEKIIRILLEESDEYFLNEVFETLVTLASRTDHPCNATWLLSYLKNLTIPQRDLRWSEYLRRANEESNVVRLINWVENIDIKKLDSSSVNNTILLLSLMLTTTHRKRRDRVTRALYLIGYEYPKNFFDHTIKSLSFNDPYLPERMLASAYGIAMNSWSYPNREIFFQNICKFSKHLYSDFFAPNAKYASHHALIKDYASGIIELARKLDPYCIANQFVQYTKPPFNHFSSPFPEADTIEENEIKDAENAIHMDFGNYTIGRLIDDRANYDYQNPEYQKIKRQIKWRIKNLGYESSLFRNVDSRLNKINFSSGRSSNGSKIDRYGKKYSWIAYFEMYGWREDLGVLPEDWTEHRTSDCDIDPSFPVLENSWKPELPDIFIDSPTDPGEWLACDTVPDYKSLHLIKKINDIGGPWILLDGYIEQKSMDDREIFTFLRGLFIKPSLVGDLEERVHETLYLGNHKIPDPYEDYYTFAGEIPWSCRFGNYLRDSLCNIKQNFREILERRDIETIKKHVNELTDKELLDFRTRQQIRALPGFGDQEELIDEDGIVTLTKSNNISGVEAEIPIQKFSWESYHSEMNQIGSIDFPSPSVCNDLSLINFSRSTDLHDEKLNPAWLFRKGEKDSKHSFHLGYLRKDLLDDYLAKTHQTIVWINWGERSLYHELLNSAGRDSKIHEIRNEYKNLHKTFIRYREI